MNKVWIVGNLTRDPDMRITQSGLNVCTFTVAVNRRRRDGQEPEADFFRVTAWRQLADNCVKYLTKGRKVAVTGPVSVSTYQAQDGSTRASLDVTADDVEFLSPKNEQSAPQAAPQAAVGYSQPKPATSMYPPTPLEKGYVEVDDEELPF